MPFDQINANFKKADFAKYDVVVWPAEIAPLDDETIKQLLASETPVVLFDDGRFSYSQKMEMARYANPRAVTHTGEIYVDVHNNGRYHPIMAEMISSCYSYCGGMILPGEVNRNETSPGCNPKGCYGDADSQIVNFDSTAARAAICSDCTSECHFVSKQAPYYAIPRKNLDRFSRPLLVSSDNADFSDAEAENQKVLGICKR